MVEAANPSRLLLLDGHSLAYRAFYALKDANLVTTTGQHTEGVYGFTSMLINVLRDEQPSHVAVAFDVSRKTFRSERFPEYKANRSKSPEEFSGQLDLVKEVLTALRIPYVEKEGYEADDIIATLATQAERDGLDVSICTGDRDAFQLVSDHVTVLYPRRGVSDLSRMTPEAVQEKYGLTPAQYPDFAALRGDPSDNLPNIPSVGEKTAVKWVAEFGTLDELVARADEVKGKAGDALRAHLGQVMTNRQLTELVRDVPLEVHLDQLARQTWDREAVHQLFDTLQFRVLRDRLYEYLEAGEPEAEEGFEIDAVHLEPGEVAGWLAEHLGAERAGVSVRGTWGRGTGEITELAVATTDGAGGWFEPSRLTPEDDAAVAAWLADPERGKVMHDAKGPMHALAARGWELRGLSADTELTAFLALPGQRSYDLADLVLRFLGRELRAEAAGAEVQLSLDGGDEEQLGTDETVRARAVLDLAAALEAELDKKGGRTLLDEVELPLVQVLASMERAGIAVDVDHLHELESSFGGNVAQAADDAYDAIGRRDVNLGSPKQLQAVLFDDLALPKTKRIKTGYTTDAESLAELYAKTEHPFLEALLRHRDASKLRVTVEGLLNSVSDDGRIHTTFAQTIAATGRLSSADPNLQNIPIRTDEGRRIRAAFVVGDGYETLLSADYSQIEMRIMAHLSDDQELIDAFASGMDFHSVTASRVFDVPAEEVSGGQRAKIKAMNYGLAYGLSSYGLSRQLNIPVAEAQTLMDEYFETFGGVRDYLSEVVERARMVGWTETMLGRRRYLPDLTSDNRQRREMAERMALNAPIQGSAADIIKVAMLRVERALAAEKLGSRTLLQVHDELVLEVAPGERDQVIELVRREMGAAYPLRVPLDVSIGLGRTWQDAGH
ncbi:DNA polymerase I [Jiangella asiatica]|uniref:DNA polymerase I n=1 Tax=Jiangella asiatica TaxID=2530372 RepID=A0A4R5CIV0_9ACTN|nr:DNA polymerase I [Jiangella asiatica]TDE00189.1 DNA polymerase I [Jiangella asiatica]